MLPIANAVLQQLKDTELQAEIQDNQKGGETNLAMELHETKEEVLEEKKQKQETVTQDQDSVCKWKSRSALCVASSSVH